MNSQFQQEQKRVNDVINTIKQHITKLEQETKEKRDEVIYIRKHFWDEIKVNIDTFDDYLETIIGLRQEAQALSVNEGIHRHASKRLATLRRMVDAPYFGRIDFKEKDSSKTEQVYIGISTLTDSSGDEILIYDWRAPISSIYYDYEPGPAHYETPSGQIEGELEKKWQYLIHKGELESMFDTSITIGDEILQKVLGKGTDKHMHNIAATIQKEQNAIIRHDKKRLLIVHGAAGSGKTSAALQRIAYLLYKYRDRINAEQIILFSPNSLFNSYVSNVLPELGEENMQQVTFQEYLVHRLKEFKVENPFEQLEYVLTKEHTPAYRARLAAIRFKASIPFFEVINSYRESLQLSGMKFKGISFKGKRIVTADQISEKFYSLDTSLHFHSRLEKIRDWLLVQLKEIEKTEWRKSWVREEIELLSNEEYHKAHVYLAKKRGLSRDEMADYEMSEKELSRLIVRRRLKPLRKSIKAYQFIDITGLYKQLFEDPSFIKPFINEGVPTEWENICQLTLEAIDDEKLLYEDATPYLFLHELIFGFQTNRGIKHIVIDEAQDYSPFQFEFLKRLFPAAKMTVLGDFNQAIFAHASENVDFDLLTNLYGPDETEVINLTKSYRSTKPIIELTRRLVPNGKEIVPFERDGNKPTLTICHNNDELHKSIGVTIAELQSRGYNNIAIICKSAEESSRAFHALSHIESIKLLRSNSTEYEQGIVVTPTYLAKGIEFDAVIIYDASEAVYGDESLRRTFYTALTRALHDLHLFSNGEPSKFLEKVIKEGFVQIE